MLCDNSQLARVYLHAYQVTGNEFYRRITVQILDYVAREMTDPLGSFYSSQDADSEGVEGKFFVWTPEEIRAALGHPERSATLLGAQSKDEQTLSEAPAHSKDAQLFIDAYAVTESGNFEGKSILYVARDIDVLAAMHNMSMEEVEKRLAAARSKLFEVRERRVKPARDEKVLTGWNGLMLAAFAEAARVLKREDYRAIAERNADFLLRELSRDDAGGTSPATIQRLRRSWKAGDVRHMGYLEDHANLIEGLLALYETTFEARWFVAARELADTMLEHFANRGGGFFDTSDDAEALVTRPKDWQDNATPSGNAMAALVLLKLGAFTGEGRYTDAAERALKLVQPALGSAPTSFAQWLSALDFALGRPKEIAIVGNGDAAKLLEVVFGEYRPNQVVAFVGDAKDTPIPLLMGRTAMNRQATAYVCRNFVCALPVTEPGALESQLNG